MFIPLLSPLFDSQSASLPTLADSLTYWREKVFRVSGYPENVLQRVDLSRLWYDLRCEQGDRCKGLLFQAGTFTHASHVFQVSRSGITELYSNGPHCWPKDATPQWLSRQRSHKWHTAVPQTLIQPIVIYRTLYGPGKPWPLPFF